MSSKSALLLVSIALVASTGCGTDAASPSAGGTAGASGAVGAAGSSAAGAGGNSGSSGQAGGGAAGSSGGGAAGNAGAGGSSAGAGGATSGGGGTGGSGGGSGGMVNNVPVDYQGTPYTALSIPGRINAADYDRGGADVAWCHSPGNCS